MTCRQPRSTIASNGPRSSHGAVMSSVRKASPGVAACSIVAERIADSAMSTPVTRSPRDASQAALCPSPHPTSRQRSPGFNQPASKASTKCRDTAWSSQWCRGERDQLRSHRRSSRRGNSREIDERSRANIDRIAWASRSGVRFRTVGLVPIAPGNRLGEPTGPATVAEKGLEET